MESLRKCEPGSDYKMPGFTHSIGQLQENSSRPLLWVRIFINRQRCRGMLNKQMQQTDLQIRQLRETAQHLIGHKMAAPGHRR